jgi:hypothetical protein
MVDRANARDWEVMRTITPRSYVCFRAPQPPAGDGRMEGLAWEAAPWTDPFVDIEGDRRPRPLYETRAKMLWDDECLYIGARLEEPHVWGTLTEKNSIIFNDNDFEVFIDPDGDNHNYYEFEINAMGTIWELTLEKPYKDGGPAVHGTNIAGLRSAVHIDGTLNDPSDTDRGWSVEIAIPWKGLAPYGAASLPPRDGDLWRMNFSRVEWRHEIIGGHYRRVPDTSEDNWVWSPQGVIDMHCPERWGFVRFVNALATDSATADAAAGPDPAIGARDLLMDVYYGQRDFKAREGRWAASLEELDLPHGTEAGGARLVGLEAAGAGYIARAEAALPGSAIQKLTVDHESRIMTE